MKNDRITTSSESTELIKKFNEDLVQKKINIPKIIQIFISEIGFIIVILLVLLIVYLIPEYHPAKIITSKNVTNFIFEQDPIIMIHTTDIHISTTRMERTDGSSIFILSLCEYNPDIVLMTGDYVDNSKQGEKMGIQNLEDWKMYNSTVRNVFKKKGFKVIDISGNHDQWAVDAFDSKENDFLDYSFIYNRTNIKDEDEFFCRKYKLNISNTELTFLLIHDYRYPVYRPPYGLDTHTTVKQYDLLEKKINSVEEKEIFALSHYPVDRALLRKSSNGLSFEEIISNEKVYAIFTGHEHPPYVRIIHHGEKGGLEYCTPAAFDAKRAGLITLDNGNLVYHEVHIPYYGNKPLFFMTYPIPNEQLTSHHIFNLNSFDIRVISYYPDNTIKLKIEGDINGELTYNHTLNNGAFLYKYKVNNLKEGNYKIHIYDENGIGCDINTEFTIGEKYTGQKEKYIGLINYWLAIRFMIIPFFISLLIIVFPFFPNLNLEIVKNIEGIIEDQEENNSFNKVLLSLYLIILSPFFLRNRLQSSNVSKIIRYSLCIFFIYPLVLPLHFMESINGKVGYTFFVFVYIDGKVNYDHWAIQMTFVYYLATLFPFILFASGKKFYNKNNIIIIIINCLLSLALMVYSIYFNFRKVSESISFAFLFFSTAYIDVLVILLIIFIISFCREYNKNKETPFIEAFEKNL